MNPYEQDDTGICRYCGEQFVKKRFWQRDCSPPKECHRLYQKRQREVGKAALEAAARGAA